MAGRARRIFLSHTAELRDYPRKRSFVAAAEVAIARSANAISNMRYWTARDFSPAAHCRQMVAEADAYVGIIGTRYGTPVRDQPELSYTELEFETATRLNMPRLVFIIAERVRLPRSPAELIDPEHTARQAAFRRRLQAGDLVVGIVGSPDELETRLYQALIELGPATSRRPRQRRPKPPRDPAEWVPPGYCTNFIGRDDDKVRLSELLQTPGALITVTGAPGCGKTRLVAELVTMVSSPGLQVIWVQVQPGARGRLESALRTVARPPESILVMDDADLDLTSCAAAAKRALSLGATVISTSRRSLGIYGERLVTLAPLPVPHRHLRPAHGDEATADVEALQAQESVALFVDRARLAAPRFELDRSNAAAVFDVCRWLDGIPLAIELAALRLRQMSVTELAHNLKDLLTWLSGNVSDVPGRHASLAAAIGWSFEQLDQRQRTVAARLSLFESTFTLNDGVIVGADEEYPRDVVVTTMMDLLDRSLLTWVQNADQRAMYRWLRPIKQYFRWLLDQSDDQKATGERYRSWVRQVMESFDADPPRRASEWERMADLTPELVSAVYALPASEQDHAMARMTAALSTTLQFGHMVEHVKWFGRALDGGPRMLREAAILARLRGDFDDARASFELVHRMAASGLDQAALAQTALDLADVAIDGAKYAEAAEHGERAATLYERLDDERGRIGVLHFRGKLHREMGDLEAAEAHLQQAMRIAEQIEDRHLVAHSVQLLGVCHSLQSRISLARGRLEESLVLSDAMHDYGGMVAAIEAFALLESRLGNHELVLELLGAAHQYRRSSGLSGIASWWREQMEQVEAEARITLIATPWEADRLMRHGAALTLAEAGYLALTISTPLTSTLGDPVSSWLRHPIGNGPVEAIGLGRVVASTPRDTETANLDLVSRLLVESSGTDTHAFRHLYRSQILTLGEPAGSRATDLLSFAIDPRRYRGLIVPAFTSTRTLADAIDRHPSWASRPVVEIRMQHLSATLGSDETVVVNPWTSYEFRIKHAEQGHVPSVSVGVPTEPA